MVWPLVAALALGAAGAVIGGSAANKKAKKQNKAIIEAAGINMESVDRRTQQTRQAYYDSTAISSENMQDQIAIANNALGGKSGASITQYIASNVAAGEIDQYIRKRNLANQIKANEFEKSAIVSNAKSGIVSPSDQTFQGAVGGFITGAQLGLGIGGAIDSAANYGTAAKQSTDIAAKQGTLLDVQIAGAQASLMATQQAHSYYTQQFGEATAMKSSLGYSNYRGPVRNDWTGYESMNPIYPR